MLNRTFAGGEADQAEALLEAASDYLRAVIGQEVFPQRTSTYDAYPSFGREDLPQWPVVSVDSVKRGGVEIEYTYRPGYVTVRGDEPVEITFTWGVEESPGELKRLTCVLAAQALAMFETTGSVSAGGLSSIAIDDFRAAFADGGNGTGIALSPHAEKAVRRQFGRGSIVTLEAYT